MQPCSMLFEEGVDFHARLKAEEMANFRLGETLCAIALDSQRFQCGAGEISAACNDLSSQFIRNVEGDLHSLRIPPKIVMKVK